MTVGLVSLGCSKNAVDLQVMAGRLLKKGHTLAPSPDCADVIIVNTCAFIESAREEAAAEILRACELKRAGRCRAVVASGCFVQRYREDVLTAFPDLDGIIGIDDLDEIDRIVEAVLKEEEQVSTKIVAAPCRVFDPSIPALRFTGKAFAYLKIAEGCAHKCTYCAIPGIRGKYRSRALKSIVAEARELVKTGVRELNVIAQDPMLYGIDFHDGTNLVSLLKAIDRIRGDFWVRVLYSYPSEITPEFVEWMNKSRHAVRYIDVPLQHTDPDVLKMMGRGSAVKATLKAASFLRDAIPEVTLRTTVMTGFPGETKARFERMLADIKEMKFDHLGAFAFSPEEGTPAAAMKGRAPRKVAESRLQEVMAAQKKIWARKAKLFVAKEFKALVTAPGIARLESQAPDVDGVVRVDADAPIGEFVQVKITKVKGFDFVGEIVRK